MVQKKTLQSGLQTLQWYPIALSMFVCSVAKWSQTPFGPMDCSRPGSSVHGISKARILEWVVMPLFRWSFQPRDQTHISCVSCNAGGFFTAEPLGKPLLLEWDPNSSLHPTRSRMNWILSDLTSPHILSPLPHSIPDTLAIFFPWHASEPLHWLSSLLRELFLEFFA